MFLIDHFHDFGGTERHVVELARRMDRDRFECVICPLSSNPEYVDKIKRTGVRVIPASVQRIYGFSGLRQAARLIRFVRLNHFDVVQSFNVISDILAAVVGKIGGARTIISSRRDLGDHRKKRHLYATRFTDRWVSHYLAVCDKVALSMREREGIPAARITTVYNGIDSARSTEVDAASIEQIAGQFDIGPETFVVGNVSHFRPEKNHLLLLDAIEKVRDEIANLRLILLGDGPTQSAFERQVEERGLTDVVFCIGYVENVPDYVRLMDVCCLTPSKNEGFSNAILEQMELAKPVIATDVGGNSEAVADGETGYVVPANSVDRLADAILKLYRDPALRARMGKNGRERVIRLFSSNTMVQEMEDFYTQSRQGGFSEQA